MDFGHSEDTIVTQNDITLEYSGHEESIPMEFEHNEEQPILMDTGGEEIIGNLLFLIFYYFFFLFSCTLYPTHRKVNKTWEPSVHSH